jgi:hypothetical protein
VNIGRELAGKFPWPMQRPCAAGRLDVGDALWHYAPPRFTGADHSMPNPALELLVCTFTETDASLSWTL